MELLSFTIDGTNKTLMIQIILLSLFFSFTLQAKTLDGITMPDTITIGNKELLLNGMGTRKATLFKVKVYVGGLYIAEKSNNVQQILNMYYPKQLKMSFIRDVSREQMVDGWNEAFENALGKNKKLLQKEIDQFNLVMGKIKDGEEILITFSDSKVIIKVPNKIQQTIINKDFPKALLSIWFLNAKDQGLRDGLLGK